MEETLPTQDKPPSSSGCVFALIGTIFTLIGFGFGAWSVSLWVGTVRTEGTVVGSELRSENDGGWIPVVRYEVAGKSYECKGIVGSGNGPPYSMDARSACSTGRIDRP